MLRPQSLSEEEEKPAVGAEVEEADEEEVIEDAEGETVGEAQIGRI